MVILLVPSLRGYHLVVITFLLFFVSFFVVLGVELWVSCLPGSALSLELCPHLGRHRYSLSFNPDRASVILLLSVGL
jgi:hypothetical protein